MGILKPYYEMGDITLYCADCRELLPILEADLLLTDPDYGVGMDYGSPLLTPIEADGLLVETLRVARIRTGHALLFWSGSWGRICAMDAITKTADWPVRHFGIWYKPNGAGASGNGLGRRFETWFWLDKGIMPKRGEWSRLPDCIAVNRVYPGMQEASPHPSQKPEELIRRLIRFMSRPRDVILDPFAGSGTTLRAALDLGRKAIGIEQNEEYCRIAVGRLAQAVLPQTVLPRAVLPLEAP